MKKFICIMLLTLISIVGFSTPYHKKCVKCIEESKKNKQVFNSIGIAWRDYTEYNVHKDGKVYGVYRCQYGHKFLVCLGDEEKK